MDACAIITGNFLASARTLVGSYRRHNPLGRFFVLMIDDVPGIDLSRENFTVIRPSELSIQDFSALSMLYSAYELSMALRPVFLLYLQEKQNAEKLVFLDSDLYFTGSLETCEKLLDDHSIVLTPSFLSPIPEDGYFPSDRDFLAAGIFNGGFFACKRCNETVKVLHWLSQRLHHYSFFRPEESMFGDQKWLDLLPAIAPQLHVIRDPGYNVSHWNLHEREITETNGTLYAHDVPLIFYHFSGFKPSLSPKLSTHQNRYKLEDLPILQKLVACYNQELQQNGYEAIAALPYTFGAFQNGAQISPIIRRVYEFIKGPVKFPDPWKEGSGSFFAWLTEKEILLGSKVSITNLHRTIWRLSVEAQSAFPQPATKNLAAFSRWILKDRAKELDLDPRYTECLKKFMLEEKSTKSQRWKLFLRRRHTFKPYQVFTRGMKRIIGRTLYYRLKPVQDPTQVLRFTMKLQQAEEVGDGMNIVASFSGETGIAEGARGLLKSCEKAGISVQRIDSQATPGRQGSSSVVQGGMYDTTLVVGGLDELIMSGVPEGKRVIGYIPWELSIFPEQYRDLLQSFDEIWTLSQFSTEALSSGLSAPVLRMPLAVDVSCVSKKSRKDFDVPDDVKLFLFIFDFHSTMERKNPLGLIKSFIQAFNQSEDVLLLISTSHSKDFPRELRDLTATIEGQKNIRIQTEYLSRPDILALMQCADFYVSLHRSEGFGLTIAESMALGTPVIATDYGGSIDFLHASTGYGIGYELTTIQEKIGPYPAGARWAEADTDEAASVMRYVLEHPEEVQRKAKAAQEFISQNYSTVAVGERMKKRLELLRKQNS